MEKPMTAAVYMRVATKEQLGEESVKDQMNKQKNKQKKELKKATESLEWQLCIRVHSNNLIDESRAKIAELIKEGYWNGYLEQDT